MELGMSPWTSADEPMDALDVAVLGELRSAYAQADPVPADLVDRVRFALALENIDVEILRLREELDLVTGVRGEEQCRTITFDSERLTIMIRLSTSGDDGVRIDGWLAPPRVHAVEVRTVSGALTSPVDDDGRFVVEPVPRGMAQIVVNLPGEAGLGSGRTVVTPSIVV